MDLYTLILGFWHQWKPNSTLVIWKNKVCKSDWRSMLDNLNDKNFDLFVAWVQEELAQIYCDNKYVIVLSNNRLFQKKSKHDSTYHFIREIANCNQITIEFSICKDQPIDMFTKPFSRELFEFHGVN